MFPSGSPGRENDNLTKEAAVAPQTVKVAASSLPGASMSRKPTFGYSLGKVLVLIYKTLKVAASSLPGASMSRKPTFGYSLGKVLVLIYKTLRQ